MKDAFLVAIFAALFTLAGCASTPSMPTSDGGSQAGRSGDASGETGKVDPMTAFSYMGAAVNSSAQSTDQVTGTNSAPVFQIMMPGAVKADPMEEQMTAELSRLRDAWSAAEGDERLALDVRITETMTGFAAYLAGREVRESDAFSGDIELRINVWMWGTSDPAKLEAAAIKAAGEGIGQVMKPASNATE